ncbi:serine O-acetyltransferase [Actinotalea ferrariae]|uniref:serine O-acetyltransferase n=1 Tax=Actinotalea ferrariae TaxID=1386098 RepID=UPI001C1DD9EF|nr:serine acetyltransferase [Actinotalea ferrariae]
MQWFVFRVARVLVVNLYGIEIPPDVVVGRRLRLPHPHGIVIVPGSVVGDDCLLRHNVTLGLASPTGVGRPTLGNRVQLGPGATVMGGISVGDDTLIGPNALVIRDVPANSRVVAPVATVRPARRS